jgi:hypothetical protein
MRITTGLCTAVAVVVTSSMAGAQNWGQPSPRDGACFYEDVNYRGEYFCVEAGQDLATLPNGVAGRISSVRVFGSAEVQVYDESRYRGRSVAFDSDVRNLDRSDMNGQIASIRVRNRQGDWGAFSDNRRFGDGGPFGSDNGRFGSGSGDGSYAQNPERIIRRAYADILGRRPDPEGLRLYRSRMIDDGWTEQQVREALRTSPEYREQNTMTYPRAQEVVRLAYLAVLGREPDAGSRGYVENVMRQHWTQQDVERELRRSAEYRNSTRR